MYEYAINNYIQILLVSSCGAIYLIIKMYLKKMLMETSNTTILAASIATTELKSNNNRNITSESTHEIQRRYQILVTRILSHQIHRNACMWDPLPHGILKCLTCQKPLRHFVIKFQPPETCYSVRVSFWDTLHACFLFFFNE